MELVSKAAHAAAPLAAEMLHVCALLPCLAGMFCSCSAHVAPSAAILGHFCVAIYSQHAGRLVCSVHETSEDLWLLEDSLLPSLCGAWQCQVLVASCRMQC